MPLADDVTGTELDSLLGRVADGDADAFAAFYDQTRSRVFGLVCLILADARCRADTTQQIYRQVWRGANGYDPSLGSPLAWLLTLAHRCALDRVGAGSTRCDEDRRAVDPLGSLTDTQHECLRLAYYQGLSYAQVAERLSQLPETVDAQVRGGIAVLRRDSGID